MAHLNPIDHSKLHYKYLGWGVDCRKNKQEWFEDLKHYSGPQLRELDKNDRNVNVIPCSVSISEEEMHSQSRDGNLGGRISGTVPFANLNAAFDIELVAKQATEEKSDNKFVVTKIVTFQDDISRDPGTVSVVSEGHEVQHSYFEEVLCGYILEYIGRKQRESKSQSHDLGKPVKDLRGQTAIARLDDYTKRCQPQLWQLVADACTYFVEKKIQCTHYVCSIKIGAERLEMKKTRKESVKLRGGVGDGMPDRKVETSRHSEGHEVHTLGNEGNELEVVSVKVKPVSSLVSERSCKLKVVMERLLESYDEIVYGEYILMKTEGWYRYT